MSSRFGSCISGRMDSALLRRGVTLCALSTGLLSIRQMLYKWWFSQTGCIHRANLGTLRWLVKVVLIPTDI